MEYSSESELIESLDYLTLPVKRSSSIGKGSSLCEKNKTPFLDLRNTKTQTSHYLHKFNDSLILNSKKEEIVEYYAIVDESIPSNNSKGYLQAAETPAPVKPKSLIKVTVTSRKTKPHKSNAFTRRKQNQKHLHNTVSVEDRSIQTKHMCLVVTGRKRERQYNIKTTESAKLLNDISKINDDISLEQIKSVRQVINSLNMDKKRKKSPTNKRSSSPPKNSKTVEKKTEKTIQTNVCHSVVRITGQIGLGEDNQIMVRCGVEGSKVPTNKDVKGYQDSKFVQPHRDQPTGTLLHTVNQGTQMDIGMVDNAQKKRVPVNSNNLTCICHNENEFEKRCQSPLVIITVYPNDERCENVKILKQHTRCPATIENIYGSLTNVNCIPQSNQTYQYHVNEQYPDEVKTESINGTRDRRPRSATRSEVGQNTEKKDKRDSSRPRSRSRSTTNSSSSQNVKRRAQNAIISTVRPMGSRNSSPNKKPAQYSKLQETENKTNGLTRPKTQSPDTNSNQNRKRQETRNKTDEKYVRSPNSSRSPSPSLNLNHNVKRQNTEHKQVKGNEPRQKKYQRKEKETRANVISTSTNTDHVLTKKALVDTFTKEIMGQMGKRCKNKCKKTQLTESQIAINIDGEDDNYDVYLQHGRLTTDVRVKKTMKCRPEITDRNPPQEYPSPDLYNAEETSKSLLNMIDVDNFRSNSYESPTAKIENFQVPEIKVRDSLEIGHKRKDRTPRNTREENEEYDYENRFRKETHESESFAPIKHYRGDRCLIPDPIKRDKEVRQLLGLEVPPRNECFPCPCPMPHHKKYFPARPCQLYRVNDHFRTRKTIGLVPIVQDETRTNRNTIITLKQTTATQYEAPNFGVDCPISKKMILNRNIQVFLQVENFTEHKPIMLSRKQYHKVKQAIDNKISKHAKHKLAKPKGSVMTTECKKKVNIRPIKKDGIEKANYINIYATKSKQFANKETAVLFTREFKQATTQVEETIKHYISAADMRISHSEPFNESSTKVAVGSSYSHSIHTLFKGLKKSRTPNLGTSACSFFSNSTNEYHECKSVKHFKTPLEKPRKPFLKRLMSCLILRASTASEVKLSALPQQKASYNSSVDSYHISTSLGAIEMSSSIYDTSESFYSNHSIVPINNKIKRSGFFGSMRGLLSYGRN